MALHNGRRRTGLLGRAIALAVCVGATACSAGTGSGLEATGAREDAIIGGTPATTYPEAALVSLNSYGQLSGYCSGSVIAPKVVLSAGHCVYQVDSWDITAPYGGGSASATSGATYDWADESGSVNPDMHDVGLIFLDTPIVLDSYPTLASSPLSDGTNIVNIGRIQDGQLSESDLFVSSPLPVYEGASQG